MDKSFVFGEVPPTSVWKPSVEGDASIHRKSRKVKTQTITLTEPRTTYEIAPEHPSPTLGAFQMFTQRIYSNYRVGMQITDYLGRVLVLLLIVHIVKFGLPTLRTSDNSPSLDSKIDLTFPSSSTPGSSIPLPNHTYIIRSKANGKTLNRGNGYVFLTKSSLGGSSSWNCVQIDKWLGFRDTEYPYAYLGHNINNDLEVKATVQQGWEKFGLRSSSDGYRLQMVHSSPFRFDVLWYVGLRGGNLAKISDQTHDGLQWEFFEV